jgi:hypothetical protein
VFPSLPAGLLSGSTRSKSCLSGIPPEHYGEKVMPAGYPAEAYGEKVVPTGRTLLNYRGRLVAR